MIPKRKTYPQVTKPNCLKEIHSINYYNTRHWSKEEAYRYVLSFGEAVA